MRMKLFAGAALIAGMAALPAGATERVVNCCVAGKATPASYEWNFRGEAAQSLQQLQMDAAKAEQKAAELQSFTMDPNISWQVHATDLQTVKNEVNDIGRRLCRLEQIERVTSPWEKKAINDARALMPLLADNTTDAVNFVNANEKSFWEPVYRKYVNNLYAESHSLSRVLDRLEDYAKLRREDVRLGKAAGMIPA